LVKIKIVVLIDIGVILHYSNKITCFNSKVTLPTSLSSLSILLYDVSFTIKLINFTPPRVFLVYMRVFVINIRLNSIIRTPKLHFYSKLYIQRRQKLCSEKVSQWSVKNNSEYVI
jgi:hypothetical protein